MRNLASRDARTRHAGAQDAPRLPSAPIVPFVLGFMLGGTIGCGALLIPPIGSQEAVAGALAASGAAAAVAGAELVSEPPRPVSVSGAIGSAERVGVRALADNAENRPRADAAGGARAFDSTAPAVANVAAARRLEGATPSAPRREADSKAPGHRRQGAHPDQGRVPSPMPARGQSGMQVGIQAGIQAGTQSRMQFGTQTAVQAAMQAVIPSVGQAATAEAPRRPAGLLALGGPDPSMLPGPSEGRQVWWKLPLVPSAR